MTDTAKERKSISRVRKARMDTVFGKVKCIPVAERRQSVSGKCGSFGPLARAGSRGWCVLKGGGGNDQRRFPDSGTNVYTEGHDPTLRRPPPTPR